MTGGGIGAYLKSKSKMSLISGIGSGVLLALAFMNESLPTALGVAVCLLLVFGSRYWKSKKFMPSGVLGVVSAIAGIVFAMGMNGRV